MFKNDFPSESDRVHTCGVCGAEGQTRLLSRKVMWVSIHFGKCFIVTPSWKAGRLRNTLDMSSEGRESVCASPGCDLDGEDEQRYFSSLSPACCLAPGQTVAILSEASSHLAQSHHLPVDLGHIMMKATAGIPSIPQISHPVDSTKLKWKIFPKHTKRV